MTYLKPETIGRVGAQNDFFRHRAVVFWRQPHTYFRVYLDPKVRQCPKREQVLREIGTFDHFTLDYDHAETRDTGEVTVAGERYTFDIHCYDFRLLSRVCPYTYRNPIRILKVRAWEPC